VRGWREILDEPEGKRIVPEYVPVRHVLDSWLSGAATFAVN
jgi:hypothetical protein